MTFSHCLLHRYTLALKTLPLHLMEVMDVAVKVINSIHLRTKSPALPTFGQRNESATFDTLVLYQSPFALEKHWQMFLSVV